MKCFDKDYSKIYDFLYTQKDYTKETNLIKKNFKKILTKIKIITRSWMRHWSIFKFNELNSNLM